MTIVQRLFQNMLIQQQTRLNSYNGSLSTTTGQAGTRTMLTILDFHVVSKRYWSPSDPVPLLSSSLQFQVPLTWRCNTNPLLSSLFITTSWWHACRQYYINGTI